MYPCPACGFLMFTEPPGSFDICRVCGWEDDHVQLRHPFMRGGANGGSLAEYQAEILEEYPPEVREANGYQRAPDWRPLREDDRSDAEAPSTGVAYFKAALGDSPPYYWKQRP